MRRVAFPFAMICTLLLATAGGALATGTPEPVASTGIVWRACAYDAMAAYFIDGTLPAAGTVSTADSPPFGG